MAFRSDSKAGDEQITSKEIREAKDVTEWFEKIQTIPDPVNQVLVSYSGLPSHEVIPHIEGVVSFLSARVPCIFLTPLTPVQRARAFHEWPYPCIGQLRFLELNLAKHPYYSVILSRLEKGQTLLDAGCCFGQDLRKLVFDGAPSPSKLYGLDIIPAFFDLGYELFRDRDKFDATFVSADLVEPAQEIPALDDKIDIIGAFSLLHLFRLPEQKILARRLVGFLKPIAGSTIVGRQLGAPVAGHYDGLTKDTKIYVHDMDSFQHFWDDVGVETDSKWAVDGFLRPVETKLSSLSWAMPGMSWLVFRVTRL